MPTAIAILFIDGKKALPGFPGIDLVSFSEAPVRLIFAGRTA